MGEEEEKEENLKREGKKQGKEETDMWTDIHIIFPPRAQLTPPPLMASFLSHSVSAILI